MYLDHLALWVVMDMGKAIGGSTLPNAPVVDDSNDRPPLRARLAALRVRVTRHFDSEPCFDGSTRQPCPA